MEGEECDSGRLNQANESEGLGLEEPSCLWVSGPSRDTGFSPELTPADRLVYTTALLLPRTIELGVAVKEGVGIKEKVLMSFYAR